MTARETDGESVPYFLAGQKMYYIGMTGADLRPIGDAHLVGEMGGVWAHPIKVADGVTLHVTEPDGAEPVPHAVEVIEQLSHVEWRYRIDGMELKRRDFIAENEAAFVSLLSLKNAGVLPRSGTLYLQVWLKFLGNWFGGAATGGAEYWLDDGLVLGYDRRWQGRWGVACGMAAPPERYEIEPRPGGSVATLVCPFTLGPTATQSWEFLLTADHQRGHEGARQVFGRLAGQGEHLLAEKADRYHQKVFTGVALETPDGDLRRGFALAKANLQLLSADYAPDLPPYFLAGVPEYPQLFGCDTEYTIAGAVAAGFADVARSALLALADYGGRACGRIPHEITTNGRVFHPGNTQETPQFAAACWDYVRWTGDLAFLRRIYPICREGVDEYLPALWGGAGGPYPIGDGVVERHGMGPRKLDGVCYLFQALEALRDMAAALELFEESQGYETRLNELRQQFERDWWIDAENMYADSLHDDGTPRLDGHWTVVLPLQLGMAGEPRGRRALDRIEKEWVNRWGLVHTREKEQLVWTLPTGLLALTAFRYRRPELGLRLLQNIAETASYGTLGAFKELIPIGLCFVQLWSAGLYLQGMLEGMLGVRPLAHLHRMSISPKLPAALPFARITALRIGDHLVSLEVWPTGLEVEHTSGPERLDVRYELPNGAGPIKQDSAGKIALNEIADGGARWLGVALMPGQRVGIRMSAGGNVHIRNRREGSDNGQLAKAGGPDVAGERRLAE